jgi:F0F1-type ATP synthase assembly protein I
MVQRQDRGESKDVPDPGPPASGRNAPPTWVALSSVGFEFVAAVLLPGALGWWADRTLHTSPWLMIVGGVLGFIVGLRLLMKSVTRNR